MGLSGNVIFGYYNLVGISYMGFISANFNVISVCFSQADDDEA
jgi:hypothetical protein